jgi:hypothetical protein
MQIRLSVRYASWGFPYTSEVKEKSVNHGYFDYKRNPEQIPNIPEVQDWPELEEFVRSVNARNSFFRTLGCDVGHTDREADGYIHLKSFVDIAFEILELNFEKLNYYLTFDRLMEDRRYYQLPNNVSADYVIQYTIFNDHKPEGLDDKRKTGWSATLRLHGIGRTEEEARNAWAAGLQFVQEALARASVENVGELRQGRETIS